MNEYDAILRGLVDRAFAVRGSDDSRAACEAIIDFHRQWPLIEFEIAMQRGAATLAAREAKLLESVAAMRGTYV